jgi:hypothetical protein
MVPGRPPASNNRTTSSFGIRHFPPRVQPARRTVDINEVGVQRQWFHESGRLRTGAHATGDDRDSGGVVTQPCFTEAVLRNRGPPLVMLECGVTRAIHPGPEGKHRGRRSRAQLDDARRAMPVQQLPQIAPLEGLPRTAALILTLERRVGAGQLRRATRVEPPRFDLLHAAFELASPEEHRLHESRHVRPTAWRPTVMPCGCRCMPPRRHGTPDRCSRRNSVLRESRSTPDHSASWSTAGSPS